MFYVWLKLDTVRNVFNDECFCYRESIGFEEAVKKATMNGSSLKKRIG